jgi:rod shape-determining protein MreC
MSYLLDKKNQKKKFLNYAIFAFVVILIFYFRVSIFSSLSAIGSVVFRPVLILKNSIGSGLSNLGAGFSFKSNLSKENEDLKAQLSTLEAKMLNYNSILDENNKIKEILGRKNDKTSMVLSAILGKPNRSPYDTLVIDAGLEAGVSEGNLVFAFGDIPIGHVGTTYANSSKVILFSSSGTETEVVVGAKDILMPAVGRGGGNFEMILPRDFTLESGSTVTLPGIYPYVVAVVKTIISDPRDSFVKALLASPVNIQELKFVEVKI